MTSYLYLSLIGQAREAKVSESSSKLRVPALQMFIGSLTAHNRSDLAEKFRYREARTSS